MSTKHRISSVTPTSLLEDIRQKLIDRIWLGIFVIALIGTPASVSRALSTGWLGLYTFHSLLAIGVIAIFLFRGKLPFAFKGECCSLCSMPLVPLVLSRLVCWAPGFGGW